MSSASVPLHVKRALGWNLAQVEPTTAELAALTAAGVHDESAQRYASWRRSLLLVASVFTTVAFALAALDTLQGGFGELTRVGVGFELAWLAAAGGLAATCVIGALTWTRPERTSHLLVVAWLTSFLLPFAYALLPVNLLYHVHDIEPATSTAPAAPKPLDDEEEDEPIATLSPEKLEKMLAMQELAVEFVLSGSGYLLLLPAVLSLIPGAVNGCLRIKALLPAAQLPGWLLVCVAPGFLLFWMVILVIANHAAQSAFLVFGVLCWAGAPIWYSLRGRVFVQSQIGPADAARIGGVKRLVLITTLVGLALLLAFVLTSKVAGLKVVGFHRAEAVTTKIEELSDSDDEVSLEDVQMALAESKSFVYAFDLSSWRFVIDFLAKLFVVTAIFSSLVLRATFIAWKNDRSFRTGRGSKEYDANVGELAKFFEKKGA